MKPLTFSVQRLFSLRCFRPSLSLPLLCQVYIEMSRDEKSKGKAAVDLLGSQIGKSGAPRQGDAASARTHPPTHPAIDARCAALQPPLLRCEHAVDTSSHQVKKVVLLAVRRHPDSRTIPGPLFGCSPCSPPWVPALHAGRCAAPMPPPPAPPPSQAAHGSRRRCCWSWAPSPPPCPSSPPPSPASSSPGCAPC